ncbi:tol-pal system protein YbgF [Ferrimonas balearica DSM 9799]|uniref:Cell division coordinator CpoB n=1 Tax=Ferrimonas balearica (strain DSM 9799 / CCM 4581 / KCTC 23876 / PAT) TaxID=550540 RepID=E1SLC4_FERBD|nr:tol-pal system protein YbgF [Ferrimonas balearica]ADN76488.1 tol-pal system protein YbgF [Ferrimonas balearica DSM 9799]MBY5980715.1 tol-pal system protein YbgF [Ferrimonas balearica]
MKRVVIVTALLCWGAQPLAAPAPVVEAAPSSARSGDINSRVDRLERQMQARNQSQLQLQQTLDQMQREIGELRGQSENQAYQIQQMLERQRQLYQDLAKLQSAPQAAAPAATAPSSTPAVSSLSEADAYTQALNLATKERRFDDAIPAFRRFIEQYPDSSYTPNAYYWLGQLLYNQGQLAEAGTMFATVADKYPKSSKRSDSLLKQGLIADRQGDKATAQRFFKQVISEYSGSSAANMAQKHLN